MRIFKDNLNEHLELFTSLVNISEEVEEISEAIYRVIEGNNKVMICGNGGSAADSQHFASELTGRFIKDRKPLPAFALTTDSSALTCIGNDYSFDHIFSRQVEALGNKGDCLIGISTSGNSANVLKAFQIAKEKNIKTISLLGNDGGQLKALSDLAIVIPSKSTARIQEAHILIYHTICGSIEEKLGLV